MKNLFLLPTDKPSVLCKRNDLKTYHLGDFDICNPDDKLRTNQNIYITSNEDIKKGWIYNSKENLIEKAITNDDLEFFNELNSFERIISNVILTTDQDLIEDGVQATNDEFLEWFVKNPNCEQISTEEVYFSLE